MPDQMQNMIRSTDRNTEALNRLAAVLERIANMVEPLISLRKRMGVG